MTPEGFIEWDDMWKDELWDEFPIQEFKKKHIIGPKVKLNMMWIDDPYEKTTDKQKAKTLKWYKKLKGEKMEIDKICITTWKALHGKHKGKNVVHSYTILTLCGRTARGLSICSNEDDPNDYLGGFLAKNAAMRALKGRAVKEKIVRKEAIKMIQKTLCPFIYKSELNPVLSFQEEKALKIKYEVCAPINEIVCVNHTDTLSIPINSIQNIEIMHRCSDYSIATLNMICDQKIVNDLCGLRDSQ